MANTHSEDVTLVFHRKSVPSQYHQDMFERQVAKVFAVSNALKIILQETE